MNGRSAAAGQHARSININMNRRSAKMTRGLKWASSVIVFATAAAITAVSGAGSAADRDTQEHNEGRPVRAGNGPGPGPNGPGPGCNVIPPLASTGTKVDISE